MQTHRQPSANSEVVTCKFPPDFIAQLDALGGDNRSENLRAVATFGLHALMEPDALDALDLHQQVVELQALANRWPGTQTPSGATWIPSPDLLPDTARVPAPALLACPVGVILAGAPGSGIITADMEAEMLTISGAYGNRWSVALRIPDLVALIPAVAAALHRLAAAPARASLPIGLTIERRQGGGLLEISGGGQAVVIEASMGFAWLAELAGLLAGRLRAGVDTRIALEQTLSGEAKR